MLDITSFSFDLTGYSLKEQSPEHRAWVNAKIVANMLYFRHRPIGWPFDVNDLEAASDFYRKQCADNGGVMLSIAPTTAAGLPALRGLFKYRSPKALGLGSRAMCYVGILWLPLGDNYLQINVEAFEFGTTGMREAIAMVAEPDLWPPRPPDDQIPIINSEEELQQRIANTPLVALPSDDERFDEGFPDHPLSQVRARLPVVIASLKIQEISEEPQKPQKKGWRFWR